MFNQNLLTNVLRPVTVIDASIVVIVAAAAVAIAATAAAATRIAVMSATIGVARHAPRARIVTMIDVIASARHDGIAIGIRIDAMIGIGAVVIVIGVIVVVMIGTGKELISKIRTKSEHVPVVIIFIYRRDDRRDDRRSDRDRRGGGGDRYDDGYKQEPRY